MQIKKRRDMTRITVSDENKVITVCYKTKGNITGDDPQLYIEDEDGFEPGYINLKDEEIDELIKALERSKKVIQ
jgi:hypothetical protein